jgi:hypothetical protein
MGGYSWRLLSGAGPEGSAMHSHRKALSETQECKFATLRDDCLLWKV